MAGFHQGLLLPNPSVLHRLDPSVKIAAVCAFTFGVALTPRRLVGAFFIDAAVVGYVLFLSGYRPATVARRAVILTPILVFAATVPFISAGPKAQFGPFTLSTIGVWASWNTVIKSLLGFGAALVLAGTTSPPDLVRGLQRLRVPALVVSILSFMFRYLDLIVEELGRMRNAMIARGHDPRWLWQAKPLAASAGALFVRSFERGERIQNAMLARGFSGELPGDDVPRAPVRLWLGAAAVAAIPFLSIIGSSLVS